MSRTESLFSEFVSKYEGTGLVEAVAVADGDSVIAEHRYVFDRPRCVFSHAKSFGSTGIGIAADEGLIGLDEKLADLYPEYVTDGTDPTVSDIKLKDLLTMRSGFGKPYLMGDTRGEAGLDWIKYMFSQKHPEKPGERFEYSNADTFLATCMLEKRIGRSLQSYLFEKLFEPCEIVYPAWETSPRGHTMSATGLYLRLRDQLKLGQIYLNGGTWRGRRIVSREWTLKASSPKVGTFDDGGNYGYQFWIYPDGFGGAYRADGAYGQLTVVKPSSGLIISIQSPENGDFSRVNVDFKELVKAL